MNFTKQIFQDVREFYKGQRIILPNEITPLTKERHGQRDLFLLEEYRELENGLTNFYNATKKDKLSELCEVYDAFADILYIAAGTLLEKGIQPDDFDFYAMHLKKRELLKEQYEFLIKQTLGNFNSLLSAIYTSLFCGYAYMPENSEANTQCLIECWGEVQRSNLSKRLPDGSYIYNEYGKIVKPNKDNNAFRHEYSKADLLPIIQKYFS